MAFVYQVCQIAENLVRELQSVAFANQMLSLLSASLLVNLTALVCPFIPWAWVWAFYCFIDHVSELMHQETSRA